MAYVGKESGKETAVRVMSMVSPPNCACSMSREVT